MTDVWFMNINNTWMYSSINAFIWMIALYYIHQTYASTTSLFSSDNNDIWVQLVNMWPYSHCSLYVLMTTIFSVISFYPTCIYFELLYKYNILSKYRFSLPYEKAESLSLKNMAIFESVFTVFVIYPLLNYFLFNFDEEFFSSRIPNLWIIAYTVIGGLYLFDILFFCLHSLLHTKQLYKYHKKHHTFHVTEAWTAPFSTIVEVFVSSIPSLVIPIALLKMHPVCIFLFIVFRNFETLDSHSNYDLPFYFTPLFVFKYLPGHWMQSRMHSFHHLYNDGCYGFYCTDVLFGTHRGFMKFMMEKN